MSSLELETIISESLAAEEQAKKTNDRIYSVVKPLFSPVLLGLENIPDKPVLFVGNHAAFALDVPLIQSTVWHETGRLIRAMADKVLFSNSTLGNIILKQGGVLGHPVVCSALMEAGKDLMVFPGGSFEVNKPVEERYQLKWKERYGFVKLAAEHGYTILPFGSVGPDEFYGRYLEGEQWYNSRFGEVLKKYGLLSADIRSDLLLPIPRGLFGTFIPKPQRFYMGIGQPIDLSAFKGTVPGHSQLSDVREQVANSINQQISSLLILRAQRSEKDGWIRRQLTR